jgi:hypothetical protein
MHLPKLVCGLMASLLAVLIGWPNSGSAQPVREPYLQLAVMTLTVPPSDVAKVHDLAGGFSNTTGSKLELGNFPRNGRTVLNMSIRFAPSTFFHMSDFRSAGVFEIGAYSHALDARDWQSKWCLLQGALRDRFGPLSVKPDYRERPETQAGLYTCPES